MDFLHGLERDQLTITIGPFALLLPDPLHPLPVRLSILPALDVLHVPEHVCPIGPQLLDRFLDIVQRAVGRSSGFGGLALLAERGVEVGLMRATRESE